MVPARIGPFRKISKCPLSFHSSVPKPTVLFDQAQWCLSHHWVPILLHQYCPYEFISFHLASRKPFLSCKNHPRCNAFRHSIQWMAKQGRHIQPPCHIQCRGKSCEYWPWVLVLESILAERKQTEGDAILNERVNNDTWPDNVTWRRRPLWRHKAWMSMRGESLTDPEQSRSWIPMLCLI